jgi:hypothetical protein
MSKLSALKEILEGIKDSPSSDFDIDSSDYMDQMKVLFADRYKSNTGDRKWLAQWTAVVVTLWLVAVGIILIKNSSCFHLSDTVLVTLLGTTTLNVLGLSFIVLRGHFNA